MATTVLYPHIVCGVEHASQGADLALAEARRLSKFGGGRLTLVHVLEPIRAYPVLPGSGVQTWVPDMSEFRDGAEKWLVSVGQAGETTVILDGIPHRTFCEWTRVNAVDLIVIGANRGLIERILLGSFASYLAHHSPCPVLLIRPDPPSDGA